MTINLSRFDLVSLRLLVTVLDSGSVTAGAQRFGISVAAASKRMSEMEAHIGATLFERRKTGVVATPTGRTVHAHAVDMVAKLEQMALAVADLQRGVSGHLHLLANTSAFGSFLPHLLADYARMHPSVALDLEDVLSEDAVRAVNGGAAELAVIGENTPCGHLQTIVCSRDRLVLAVPATHPLASNAEVALEDALQYDLIALGRSTSLTRQIAAAADRLHCYLRIRTQVRSFDAMMRMVAAGLGIAILPFMGASLYARALDLRLLTITGMRSDRVLLLAMRNRTTLSHAARSFVELVESRVAGQA